MTAAELREQLTQVPDDAEVQLAFWYSNGMEWVQHKTPIKVLTFDTHRAYLHGADDAA